jgi:putative tricarboxylic transport membrane protein
LSVFVTRPLSLSLLLTALIALLIPYLPVLFNLLTGKQIRSGRIVFGQGEED